MLLCCRDDKVLHFNGKAVTKADITAGDTVVYLMAAPILPQQYEEMLASLSSTDSKDEPPLIMESAPVTTAMPTMVTAPDVVAAVATGENETPDFAITSVMDPVGQGVLSLGGYGGGLSTTDDLMSHGDDSLGGYGGYNSGSWGTGGNGGSGSWGTGGNGGSGSWGGSGGNGGSGSWGGSGSSTSGGSSSGGSSSGSGSGSGGTKPAKPDQGTKPGDKGAAAGGGAGGVSTGEKGTGVVMESGSPSTTPAGAAGTNGAAAPPPPTRAEIDARSSAGSFAVSLALLLVPALAALLM
jgi:hypothetical protein